MRALRGCPVRLAVALLLGFAALAAGLRRTPVLQITEPNGRVVARFDVGPGSRLAIRFTHSLDGTPVEEVLRVDDRLNLVVEETRYHWEGAGLETHPGAGRYSFEDGWVHIRGMKRTLPSFTLRVGGVARHRVAVDGGRELALWQRVPPGTPLRFRVERVWRLFGCCDFASRGWG